MMAAQLTAFNQQTRIAVNILIEDDTRVAAFSITIIIKIFALLGRMFRFVARTRHELGLFIRDVQIATDFTVKILIIALKSLLFGLGVKL